MIVYPLILILGVLIGLIGVLLYEHGPPAALRRIFAWLHDVWLRFRRTPLRRNLFMSTWLVALIILALSMLTAVSFMLITVDAYQFPVFGDGLRSMSGWRSFLIGALLGGVSVLALLYARLLSNDMYEALAEPWAAPGRRRATFTVVCLGAFAILLPVGLYLVSTASSVNSGSPLIYVAHGVSYMDRYTGGPIGFVMAILALLAFYLTIQQLRDFQSRISNFAQLLERIVEMGKTASRGDPMYIIAYTPAIGYLAERHILWEKVAKAIIGIEEDEAGERVCKTKIITQPMTSLAKWHDQFVGRKTKRRGRVEAAQTARATEEAARIKTAIIACDRSCYIEVPFEILPGYYCFFTSRRALIVAPLFLPLSVSGGAVGTEKLASLPSPHMIGFETTDRGIIDQLFEQFDYIEAHVTPAPAPAPAAAPGGSALQPSVAPG